MANCILLAGSPQRPQEKIASAAIIPGMLVEVVPSGGDAGQLRPHGTAIANALPAFADVALVPSATSAVNAIDIPFPDGDTVNWFVARPGDVVNALLKIAAPAVLEGAALVSAGDGTLQGAAAAGVPTSATVDGIIGYSMEAIDNSAGATAVRCRVRIA